MRLALVGRERGHRGEGAGIRHQVGKQVDDGGREPLPARHHERHGHVPHVGDARIGEQALDVALSEGHDVAQGHRQNRHDGDPGAKAFRQPLLEHGREDAVENEQARPLGRDGEIGDRGCGHARVHVGGPRMERRERHLEAETHEQEEQAHGDDGIGREARLHKRVDAHAAALAEKQRDAVESERRGE